MYGISRRLSIVITIIAVLALFLGYSGALVGAEEETPSPTSPPSPSPTPPPSPSPTPPPSPSPTPPPSRPSGVAVAISEYKVLTIDGKDAAAPLMAGSSYRVDFTLDVAPGVNDTVVLETDMKLAGGQYQVFWELVGEYKGINTGTWTPGRNKVSFASEAGKAKFILRGAIADDFNLRIEADGKTSTKLDGQVVHQKKAVNLLRLTLASGALSEEKKIDVIDKSIEAYQAMLAAICGASGLVRSRRGR